MYDIFYISDSNSSDEHKKLKNKFPFLKLVASFEQAQAQSLTDFFWVVWDDLIVNDNFNFDYIPDNWSKSYVHVFLNSDYYDGIALIPKDAQISQKEIKHRFFVNYKQVDILASRPKPFDIFIIENYSDYTKALENSKTEMFWMVSNNLTYDLEYLQKFYISHHNSYDRNENHAFVHEANGQETYDGVFLLSKNKKISKREINYRYLVSRKEWEHTVSGPVIYDIFEVNTYDDYLYAMKQSKTEMFWVIPSHVQLVDTFDFNYYVDLSNEYLRTISHVFLNGKSYDGVVLSSKHRPVTKYEFERNYIANKVEINVLASYPKEYDVFFTTSYEEYLEAVEKSKYRYFWVVPGHVELLPNFEKSPKFLEKLDERSRNITHVFLNGENYNGVMLCSKNTIISKREYEYNYVIDRIEVPIQVSVNKRYDVFFTSSYEEYLEAVNNTKTKYFWVVPSHVDLLPNFDFNVDLKLDDERSRNITHVFMNGKFNDGPMICTKNVVISKKEYDFNYVANRIDHPQIVSTPKPFDIVFISYQEPNAEENYKNLLDRFPRAKRVHGVKGIHQAHIEAAKLCTTDMFWIVDGDAKVVDDFNFDHQIPRWEFDTVHVWRSVNPINQLIYGYGGIKLFPRLLTLNMDTSKPDMTTSISSKFKPMPEISNITAFNTDPFNTWKSAFRECCKLSSKIIDRQREDETNSRLKVWCAEGKDKDFGEYAISGANAGMEYGLKNRGNLQALSMINNFNWLKEQFDANT